MISFSYLEPTSIDEALATVAQHGEEARPIAGGTALINLMKQRLVQPAYLIGLRRLSGFDAVSYDGSLRIGALCTLRTIETSELIRAHAPLLTDACRQVATIRIRSMATIGGALAHADPNQDTPAALIALDAKVKLRSQKSVREIAIADFFTGYYETVTQPDELVTEIAIPAQPDGSGSVYVKFLPQTHDDYATVGVAARVTIRSGAIADARVAASAAASTPLRAKAVEDALRGQSPKPGNLQEAAALAAGVVDPIADFRGSAEYKRDMAVVFTRRALATAVARAQKAEAAI
jgi:aerobic carbon-monoxide dehydrogenase medium subunit